jgi:DNA-binding GntR family transcriptional regulator
MGRLTPSTRLKVQALSSHYRIGATAIREALSRLVTDGLVAAEEQRGFRVAPVSREELLDLTETRIQVESWALRKSLEHGDVEWEAKVLAAFHRLSRTPMPTRPELHAAWEQTHRQFHHALIAACRSPSLLRICAELYDKSERYRNLAEKFTTPQVRDTLKEHRDIMDAAFARDAAAALQWLAQHLRTTTDIILRSGVELDPTG